MAAKSPIKATYTGSDPTGLAEFVAADFIAVADGGTGAVTASDARTNLGLAIGSDVQAYDAQLADIAGLTPTDGYIIVGNGTNFVTESGATARTSLGLGTGNNVQFTDLTLTGNLTVSGTTTTINTETINLADNTIVLNSNETGTPSENGGIEIERGTSTNKTFLWDETNDKWTIGSETFVAGTVEANLTGDVTGNVTGDLTGDVTGNADTATALATARTIAGQSFDGTANILIAPTDLTGVTATAAEINKLDGVTATTTELNYVDGVTSSIQTQLDAKLVASNNLSDVSSASSARTNLDVDSSSEVTSKAVNNGITFAIALG